MVLTDSELASLKFVLRCWEWSGYASTAIVGLGCIGEFIAEFTSLAQNEICKHRLAKLSLIVLILGIAGELLSTVQTSQLSGQIIANIEERTVGLKKELAEEERKTARAQKEAAEAQLALQQYLQLVAKSVNPRIIDFKRFLELLKGKPKGTVEIWYEPNDDEARHFAITIDQALGSEGAGWSVQKPRPLPVNRTGIELRWDQRTSLENLRIEAYTGLAIGANKIGFDPEGRTALGALTRAINFSTGGWNISGVFGHLETADPTLPDNHFVIVVGHHQVNLPLVEFPLPKK